MGGAGELSRAGGGRGPDPTHPRHEAEGFFKTGSELRVWRGASDCCAEHGLGGQEWPGGCHCSHQRQRRWLTSMGSSSAGVERQMDLEGKFSRPWGGLYLGLRGREESREPALDETSGPRGGDGGFSLDILSSRHQLSTVKHTVDAPEQKRIHSQSC